MGASGNELLEVEVEGQFHQFLVDSGASLSLVKRGVSKAELRLTNTTARGITGVKLKSLGTQIIEIKLGNKTYKHEFLVTPLDVDYQSVSKVSTDFPMDELATWHLVEVYQRVGSDLGCMLKLVSTESVHSVVCYWCLCVVVFCNLVTFAMQENTEQRYAIKLCETQQVCHRDICSFNRSLWRCHSIKNYGF